MSYAHSSRHKFIAGKHRHLRSWRPSPPDHRDLIMPDPTLAPTLLVLPSVVDNRSLCSPVEDQGELGSCTANASTSAMEALYKKLGMPIIELSRLFVYYYTRKVEGTPPTEDSGAFIRDVMKALSKYGAAPEAIWPYDISQFSTNPTYAAVQAAHQHRATRYYRCPTLHSIKVALAHGFSAVGGFSVPTNMLSPECAQNGIVKMPGSGDRIEGGHAVHFVGYDDASALLTFQNSWGPGWGKQGFGFLPYGFVDQKLADDFWSIRRET
jgi:C1A family cysteine protease